MRAKFKPKCKCDPPIPIRSNTNYTKPNTKEAQEGVRDLELVVECETCHTTYEETPTENLNDEEIDEFFSYYSPLSWGV
jgi:hypothetical protein